ncbi:uncharacterized protein VNE69_03376 [Vairimorpha necatrix]|uniref:Uncharacterized protein n=1 Tax=Vairimorpha necatrix TaxID=6039 RepID=A0AAX4JBA9_9MICR
MNLIRIFLSILFLQTSKTTYEMLKTKLVNKIEKKDYHVIDLEKNYLRVKLWFSEIKNILDVYIIKEIHRIDIREEIHNIKINCSGKSVHCIVKELEDEILHECKGKIPDYIVLIYNPIYFESNPVFEEIVTFLKLVNSDDNSNIINNISYDYILENNNFWALMYSIIKIDFRYNKDNSNFPYIPVTYLKRKDQRYLCFCVYFNRIFYFFEFDIKELLIESCLSENVGNLSQKNDIDIIINRSFHELFKFTYIDKIYNDSHFYLPICFVDKNKLEDRAFMIELKKNKFCFPKTSTNIIIL